MTYISEDHVGGVWSIVRACVCACVPGCVHIYSFMSTATSRNMQNNRNKESL